MRLALAEEVPYLVELDPDLLEALVAFVVGPGARRLGDQPPFLGDELLNETIVREGYAERYRDSPDTTYRAQIIAAEQDARANNRGLWSACR